MDEGIFCKSIKGETPVNIVYRENMTLAFLDLGHVNFGHTIVAVKPHEVKRKVERRRRNMSRILVHSTLIGCRSHIDVGTLRHAASVALSFA
jgi:hypothetical protein